MTLGDEYGLYRRNSQKGIFLLFAYDEEKQALETGQKLAKLVGRSFINELPFTKARNAELKQIADKKAARASRKKVMGVTKMCMDLVAAGKSDKAIIVTILPKYIAAGYSEEKGTERILDTLYYIRLEGK